MGQKQGASTPNGCGNCPISANTRRRRATRRAQLQAAPATHAPSAPTRRAVAPRQPAPLRAGKTLPTTGETLESLKYLVPIPPHQPLDTLQALRPQGAPSRQSQRLIADTSVRPALATRAARADRKQPARLAPLPLTPPSAAPSARASVRRCLADLRGALGDGWEIVQPIFARPLWSTPDNSATGFHFVLRRERDTRLITVPGGRTIKRFITDRDLSIDFG